MLNAAVLEHLKYVRRFTNYWNIISELQKDIKSGSILYLRIKNWEEVELHYLPSLHSWYIIITGYRDAPWPVILGILESRYWFSHKLLQGGSVFGSYRKNLSVPNFFAISMPKSEILNIFENCHKMVVRLKSMQSW